MSYRTALAQQHAYAIALNAKPHAETTRNRQPERPTGTRRSPKVERMAREGNDESNQPTADIGQRRRDATLDQHGDRPMHGRGECTDAVKANGRPRTQQVVMPRSTDLTPAMPNPRRRIAICIDDVGQHAG